MFSGGFWGSWHNVLPYHFQAFWACLIASNSMVSIDETPLTPDDVKVKQRNGLYPVKVP